MLLFNSQYYLNPKSKKSKLLAIANSQKKKNYYIWLSKKQKKRKKNHHSWPPRPPPLTTRALPTPPPPLLLLPLHSLRYHGYTSNLSQLFSIVILPYSHLSNQLYYFHSHTFIQQHNSLQRIYIKLVQLFFLG